MPDSDAAHIKQHADTTKVIHGQINVWQKHRLYLCGVKKNRNFWVDPLRDSELNISHLR